MTNISRPPDVVKLRDQFATAAMQGMLSADGNDPRWIAKDCGPDSQPGGGKWLDPKGVARQAYAVADAMLAAREK